ncbi:hypothetical protein [Rubritalea sp.]|uniref:hypothetical protein n=1 Tax=Rubritalea sp. TaxID=2109375 RepID=UPI003EF7C2A9
MNHNENNDPVWKLLDHASEQKASSLFSRDVMRDIRLEEQESQSWWKKLLSPAPIVGTLATAAACIALVLSSQAPEALTPTPVAHAETMSSEQGFDALADTVAANDDLSYLIDPLSLVASYDVDLIADYEMLMDL